METLKQITDLWLKRIKYAVEYRRRSYDPVVNRLMRYYRTRKRYLFSEASGEPDDQPFALPPRYHRISVALVGQFVRVMLPYVHFKVPVRTVLPRQELTRLRTAFYGPAAYQSADAMRDQVQCLLGSHLLNYAADDATFNLREEVRKSTQEALVAGRGVVWHETVPTPYGDFPGSFYVPQQHLVIDPDHDELRDANYIVRFRERPRWEIAEEFGIPLEKIKPNSGSYDALAQEETDAQQGRSTEERKDLCRYWEIYSRMGIGHRLTDDDALRDKLEAVAESIGDHVYLAVMEGVDFPLNLFPDKQATATEAETRLAMSWPIATFGDHNDPWPCSVLDFYKDGIYPKPPLEDALPLQSFLDFAYFFLMQRIRVTSRSLLLCPESISPEVKKLLQRGWDNEIATIKEKFPDLSQLVHEIQFAPVNKDLWSIIAAIKQEWEDSTGLTPLLRGGTPEKMMRSSAEAQIRQANTQVRPDDLRDCVTAFHGAIARKEMIAQRTILKAPKVGYYFGESTDQPILGPITEAWKKYMQVDIQGDNDAWLAAQELAVTVEGSTGRRKDKAKQLADVQDASQVMAPMFLQERQLTGDPSQINAFVKLWTDAMEVENPEQFFFKSIQPPPPAGAPQQQGQEAAAGQDGQPSPEAAQQGPSPQEQAAVEAMAAGQQQSEMTGV